MALALPLSSVFAANVPAGFAVYSYEELKIGDRAGMNGGYIGCKSNVLIGYDAKISGSVLANGKITLNDRARIDGDAKSGQNIVLGFDASIGGAKVSGTSVPQYTIPTKAVPVSGTNRTIADRTSGSVAPGNYNTITVGYDATVTLSSGTYNINNFIVNNGATLKLDFPAAAGVSINVKTGITYGDRVKMELLNSHDGSLVSVYYNGTAPFKIGYDATAYGAFSAPNAMITVQDRAQVQGTVFAKKVEMQPGLFAESMVEKWLQDDSDGDGVPDYVEYVCGTNGSNAADKPMKLNTGTYANKTALASQKVTASVNHVAGYSHVADFPITFGKGSVEGDLIPVNNIIATNDYRAPMVALPLEEGYSIDGNKYHAISGEVASGKKILYAFPISDLNLGAIKDFVKLSHFNENSGEWEDVEIAYITGNAAYAFVSSFSVYAITTEMGSVYRAGGTYPTLETVFQTIQDDQVANPSTTKKYSVMLNKGTYTTIPYILPQRTNLIGGFDFAAVTNDYNVIVASSPKKNRTIIDGTGNTGSLLVMDDISGADQDISIIVDGLEFTKSTGDGAVQFYAHSGHNMNIHLLNCVFEENVGNRCGALYLFNISNVHIESSVFYNNTASGATSDGCGSAILIWQHVQCGVQASIHSSVFINNQITANANTPSGTICNAGDFEDATKPRSDRPVDIFDCTFYGNTTLNPLGGSVAFREVLEMPMSIKNSLVIDGSTTPVYNGIAFGTGGVNVVTTGTAFNPSLSNFVNTTNITGLKGSDNTWGTADDGLSLALTSAFRNSVENSSALFSARDVAGRLRKAGTTSDKQDKGAYETYLKVLAVGSQNTMGDGTNYQATLKTLARSAGYLFDFVGLSNSAGAYDKETCLDLLGENPGNPNVVITSIGTDNYTTGEYDVQMAAGGSGAADGGLISEYNTPSAIQSLQDLKYDFALINIGDEEIIGGASDITAQFNTFKAFASSLATTVTGKVLVSTLAPPADDIAAANVKITAFNTLVKGAESDPTLFGNAFYKYTATSGVASGTTVRNDMTADVGSDNVFNYLGDNNTISNPDGYSLMAQVWWNMMSLMLEDSN